MKGKDKPRAQFTSERRAPRPSEEYYRSMVEASPVSIMAVIKGRFLYVNPAGARMLGYSDPEEMVGTEVLEIVAPEEHEMVAERLERLERGGENPKAHISLIRKDGVRITVESTSVSVRIDDEPAAVVIAEDITDRIERDEKLEAMRFTVDHSLDRIGWIAPDGRFLYANIAGYEEMGFSREEILKMNISDVGPDYPPEIWRDHFQDVKKAGSMRFEVIQLDKKGETHYLDVCSNYISFGDSEFICSFGRDITERKKAEEELKEALADNQALKERLEMENVMLREEAELSMSHAEIIGRSLQMKKVLAQVEQVAPTDSTVLITGETGTGKELIARQIHSLSGRGKKPLVKVNCAALPPTLIESELFGREKGAFTGAMAKQVGRFEFADDATIFLDEIGELPLDLQAKLLRILQDGEFERLGSPRTFRVNVRVIAATNRDLHRAVQEGHFREDLYYRLNIFPISIPPLRERTEDIPPLVWFFAQEFWSSMGKPAMQIKSRTMEAIMKHKWRGNARELRNVLERAVILSNGPVLKVDLPQEDRRDSSSMMTLKELEKKHILDVLSTTGGRVFGEKGAARLLDINPKTLYSRMKKHEISRKEQRK